MFERSKLVPELMVTDLESSLAFCRLDFHSFEHAKTPGIGRTT